MTSRQDIVTKAMEDSAFREQLKRDPRGTLEHELSTSLPADVEVTVLEESPQHAYLILPARGAQLSEQDLARVAAGAGTRPLAVALDPGALRAGGLT